MTDFRCFKIAPDIRLKYRVYPGLFLSYRFLLAQVIFSTL